MRFAALRKRTMRANIGLFSLGHGRMNLSRNAQKWQHKQSETDYMQSSKSKRKAKSMPNNVVGRDQHGWYVMFGSFRSAMPDEKTARQAAAASELLAAAKSVAACFDEQGNFVPMDQHSVMLERLDEAITLAERG
jgi:hypothetical protein